MLGSRAGEAGRVEADRDQVGDRPRLDPARLGPADRRVAGGGRRAEQIRRRMVAARPGRQALVHLHAARLLEEIDRPRSSRFRGRAMRRRRRAGGPGRPRRRGRAPSSGRGRRVRRPRRGGRSRASARWVAWIAVKRPSSAPASASSAGRGHPVLAEALLVLGGLLGEVGVERGIALPRPVGDLGGSAGVDGADAVDRRPDPRPGPWPQPLHPLGPGGGAAVGEAQLGLAGSAPMPPCR